MQSGSTASEKFCGRWIPRIAIALAITTLALPESALGQVPDPSDLQGWSIRIEEALKNGDTEKGLKEISQAIAAMPKQAQLLLIRGSLYFRSGKIKESIEDFDRCIELEPSMKPYLWQRGISLYYAGRFQDGVDQFAIHRDVNPNDVENAFWYFLCQAKLEGVEAAQKSVLLAGRDSRVPMMEVQELILGKTTTDKVIEAAEKGPNKRRASYDRFYGYLYVGLYYDAIGNADEAKKWLTKSVAEKVDGYMGDVAKVHLALLEKAP